MFFSRDKNTSGNDVYWFWCGFGGPFWGPRGHICYWISLFFWFFRSPGPYFALKTRCFTRVNFRNSHSVREWSQSDPKKTRNRPSKRLPLGPLGLNSRAPGTDPRKHSRFLIWNAAPNLLGTLFYISVCISVPCSFGVFSLSFFPFFSGSPWVSLPLWLSLSFSLFLAFSRFSLGFSLYLSMLGDAGIFA